MNGLRRLWKGETSLPDAFWNWAVLGGLAVNLFSSGLFLFLIMSDQLVLALIAGYVSSVPYNVIAAVGVWRSAERYDGERRWAGAAQIATIAGMAILSLT